MQKFTLFSLLGLLLAFSACQKDQVATDDVPDNQFLAVHTFDQISGATEINGVFFKYNVVDKAGTHQLSLEVNGKVFEASINYERLAITYNGNDNAFSEVELGALKQLPAQFSSVFDPDATPEDFSVTLIENTLGSILSHWSEVPAGWVMGTMSQEAADNKSRWNDGVRCITRNRTYRIQWSGRRSWGGEGPIFTSNKRTNQNLGGGYDCMGRCGAGCSGFGGAWGLDCFEHDWCSREYNASLGGFSWHCGDEWWDAADDFSAGWAIGCRG